MLIGRLENPVLVHTWLRLATTVLSILLAVAGPVLAQPPEAGTMLVVDASGSMWGKVDGEYKIVIARRVIAELMSDWNPDLALGLSAYGHNRKGACDDIETLVEPAMQTGGTIADIVNGLNPKGKTPLTSAVVQAANTLEYKGRPASVVLLTDGEETCDLDPCAMGAALEERGIDFTVYVIGFDVAIGDQEGLRCLAESTGGEFIAANSSDELKTALTTVRQAVARSSGAADPGTSTVTLQAYMTEGDPVTDAGVEWDVRTVGDDGFDDPSSSIKGDGTSLVRSLPEGRFRIYASYGGAFKYVDVDSVPGETLAIPVIFNAGRLRITPSALPDSPDAAVLWSVYPLEGNREEGRLRDSVRTREFAEFVLNSGFYRVKGELDDHVTTSFDLLIEAGETVNRSVAFEPR